MLETNPHVKYIRICDRKDPFGHNHNILIIDTDITISNGHSIKNDYRLIELAMHIKEFQITFKKLFGSFKYIEVMGKKSLLLHRSA